MHHVNARTPMGGWRSAHACHAAFLSPPCAAPRAAQGAESITRPHACLGCKHRSTSCQFPWPSADPTFVAICICAAPLVSGQIGTLDILVCPEIVRHRGQLSVLPHVVVRVPCSKPFQQSVSLETRLIKVHRPGCRMQVALREVCQGPPKLAWVAPEYDYVLMCGRPACSKWKVTYETTASVRV